MNTMIFNLGRSLLGFVLVVIACRALAPQIREAQGWTLTGIPTVTTMLVFVIYALFYLVVGLIYIRTKRAYDRHIFPEGVRLEGHGAVKLGLKYLILFSISAFGATLIYAVILRGMRYSHLQ